MKSIVSLAVITIFGLAGSTVSAQVPSGVPAPATAPLSGASSPADARIAYVDVDRVAAISAEGKAANAKLNDLRAKKSADLEARTKQLEALQEKINGGVTVMNDSARSKLQRDFERAQIDFRRASEDAQSEVQEAQQETLHAFTAKLFPIIGEVAKEKKIWAVFGNDSGLLWHDPATDLSEEVAKRLDAASKRQ